MLKRILQFYQCKWLKIIQIDREVRGSLEMLRMRLLDTKLNPCNLRLML